MAGWVLHVIRPGCATKGGRVIRSLEEEDGEDDGAMEKTTSQRKNLKDTFQGFHLVSFERDVL